VACVVSALSWQHTIAGLEESAHQGKTFPARSLITSAGHRTRRSRRRRLCAAAVDRLTFDGNIIETCTDSYRLNQHPPR
jgi:hypothetical protein